MLLALDDDDDEGEDTGSKRSSADNCRASRGTSKCKDAFSREAVTRSRSASESWRRAEASMIPSEKLYACAVPDMGKMKGAHSPIAKQPSIKLP